MNEIAQLVLGSEKLGGRNARGIRESRRDDRGRFWIFNV